MPSTLPFLMFEGQATAAMDLYTSVVPDSEIIDVQRYGPDGPGPDGTVARATFTVAGQQVMCSDSFVTHGFTFTPSISLFVTCDSTAQLDELHAALRAPDREDLMAPGDYGFAPRFAWLTDPFGVTWQLVVEA